MEKVLSIVQMVVAILLIAAILIQNKGVGLSQTFGGSGEGNAFRTKRGAEKTVFISTIVLSVAFLGLAIANLFI